MPALVGATTLTSPAFSAFLKDRPNLGRPHGSPIGLRSVGVSAAEALAGIHEILAANGSTSYLRPPFAVNCAPTLLHHLLPVNGVFGSGAVSPLAASASARAGPNPQYADDASGQAQHVVEV